MCAYRLVGVGNPLLDTIATVDPAFLEKYGIKLDQFYLVNEQTAGIFDDLAQQADQCFQPGGAAQNTIRVAQWFMQAPVGTCAFVGSIGHDENGRVLTEALKAEGVVPAYAITDQLPTGICAVNVCAHSRTLVTNLGASGVYNLEHLETPQVKAALETSEVFYMESYFLSTSLEAMLHLIKTYPEKLVVLNMSATFFQEVPELRAKFLEIFSHVDVVIGNSDEYEAFAKAHGWDQQFPERMATEFGKPKVVVTTENSKCTRATKGPQSKSVAIKAPQVEAAKIVDTNGAGDAFAGGFLGRYLLLRQENPQVDLYDQIEACIVAGHQAAGYLIQQSGCSLPDKVPPFEV